MNMFKKVKADSVASYMASLPADRMELVQALDKFIKRTVPKLKPHFATNMLGYGSFKYLNRKKEALDWPTVALASQKQHVSMYVCCSRNGKYLAEQHKKELGKVKVGKSCINIKKLEDLDLKGLGKLLKLAAKSPGFKLN